MAGAAPRRRRPARRVQHAARQGAGAQRRRLRDARRRDAVRRRRIGLRQEHDRAGRAADSFRSRRGASPRARRCSRARTWCAPSRRPPARGARQPHLDDLPGADDLAEPGVHASASRSARRCACTPDLDAAAARARAIEMLQQVGIPAARAARRRISAPAIRRHAPARDDRDGARLPARHPDRRRADHRARRHRAGADLRSAARPAAREGHGDPAHHARHGRGRRDGRPRDGDVCRPRASSRAPPTRCWRIPATRTRKASSTACPSSAAASPPRRRGPRPLAEIAGMVPSLWELASGCAFRDRCPRAMARCAREVPPMLAVAESRGTRMARPAGCSPTAADAASQEAAA